MSYFNFIGQILVTIGINIYGEQFYIVRNICTEIAMVASFSIFLNFHHNFRRSFAM